MSFAFESFKNYELPKVHELKLDHVAPFSEMFKQSYEHVNQYGKATDHGQCLYRAPDNKACAVGAILTDDEYCSELEQNSVANLLSKGLMPERLLPYTTALAVMQYAHDNILSDDTTEASKVEWRQALRLMAAELGIEVDYIKD